MHISLHEIFLWSSNVLCGKCICRSWWWFSHSHHGILRRRSCTFSRRVRNDPWMVYEKALRNRSADFKLKSFDMFNFARDSLDVIENSMEWRRFAGKLSWSSRRRHLIVFLKRIFILIYFKVRIHRRECGVIKFNFFIFRTVNCRRSKYFWKKFLNVHGLTRMYFLCDKAIFGV